MNDFITVEIPSFAWKVRTNGEKALEREPGANQVNEPDTEGEQIKDELMYAKNPYLQHNPQHLQSLIEVIGLLDAISIQPGDRTFLNDVTREHSRVFTVLNSLAAMCTSTDDGVLFPTDAHELIETRRIGEKCIRTYRCMSADQRCQREITYTGDSRNNTVSISTKISFHRDLLSKDGLGILNWFRGPAPDHFLLTGAGSQWPTNEKGRRLRTAEGGLELTWWGATHDTSAQVAYKEDEIERRLEGAEFKYSEQFVPLDVKECAEALLKEIKKLRKYIDDNFLIHQWPLYAGEKAGIDALKKMPHLLSVILEVAEAESKLLSTDPRKLSISENLILLEKLKQCADQCSLSPITCTVMRGFRKITRMFNKFFGILSKICYSERSQKKQALESLKTELKSSTQALETLTKSKGLLIERPDRPAIRQVVEQRPAAPAAAGAVPVAAGAVPAVADAVPVAADAVPAAAGARVPAAADMRVPESPTSPGGV